MYGVSPQPVQAPEYSKSGSRNCVPLVSSLSLVRSALGMPRKYSKLFRSRYFTVESATMLSALWPFSVFDSAGQIS